MRTGRDVSVFVHRRGQVLLLRRARDGVWHIPAGGVEDGESFREAGARELLEETGLRVPVSRLLDLGQVQRYPADGPGYPPGVTEVTLWNFAAEAPLAWEPRLDVEHTDARWCGFAEAATQFQWDNTRTAFAALRAALRRNEAGASGAS